MFTTLRHVDGDSFALSQITYIDAPVFVQSDVNQWYKCYGFIRNSHSKL